MAGRHRAVEGAAKRPRVWSYLGAFVVVAVVAALTVRWLTGVDADCGEPVALTVDAAPSIAPAVTEFVTEQLPLVEGEAQCLRPRIRAADAKTVTDALTAAEPPQDAAQVWIPDSTLWLQRAHQAGARAPERGISIATSPAVFATVEPVASAAGWPGKPARWSAVLAGERARGIVEPSTQAPALFALIGIENLGWPTDQTTKLITTMSEITIPVTDNPFDRLPGRGATPPVSMFPASEQQVLRHNTTVARGNPDSLVAAYPDALTPWLDYPVAVRSDVGEGERAAGEALRKVLRSPAAAKIFAAHGFRNQEGRLPDAAAQDPRVSADAGPVGPPPAADQGDRVLKQWATISRLARVLVVLDVSESMNAPVPKTRKTRMQVTLAAASEGLGLFRPGTQLALWEFSTNLDGSRDHREVAPFKPIIQHLADGLPAKLARLVSFPKGATGLYDTTLAGYQEIMRLWDPARLNLLVIFTDGKNEDTDGISRSRLLAELGKLTDPARPAPIIFVGLGTDVDPKELRQVSRATGGQTFLAPKVTDIGKIFFTALGKLACPGGNC